MKFLFLILFSLTALAKNNYRPEVLVNQKDIIWGFDFIDGKVIFTERGGKMFTYDLTSKVTNELSGVPKVYAVGQGGLLDVRVHPKNGFIYISYSEAKDKNNSVTALARFKLSGNNIVDFKKIFEATANGKPYHYGSRIEFLNDKIFLTSGERGDRKGVQDMSTYFGKIVRMNEDGSSPEIWSSGHRNQQGLALRPGTEELWEAEMGPQGGDELNLIKKGANYGWAVITYGREYEGPKIGEGTSKKGMEQPVAYWVPSLSPSGITFHKGDIWLANLSGQHLRRLELKGQKVIKEEEHLKELGWRFRNVRSGPDETLWFSTDEGKLGKLVKQ